MITRRLALFGIAATTAAGSAGAAPVALAAVQLNSSEDPALIRLGRKIEKLDAIRQHRAKVKADALSSYNAARPEIPSELLVTFHTEYMADGEQERDWEGHYVWPDDPTKRYRRLHTVDNIRDAIELFTRMAKENGDPLDEYPGYILMSQLLPIAERHERETEAAIEVSGIRPASERHFHAAVSLEKIVRKLAAIPAKTPEGITIKAHAYEALAADCIEAYRAADNKSRETAVNFLRLLDAWKHPTPHSKRVIKTCLASLGLPPGTTYEQALSHLQRLASEAAL